MSSRSVELRVNPTAVRPAGGNKEKESGNLQILRERYSSKIKYNICRFQITDSFFFIHGSWSSVA